MSAVSQPIMVGQVRELQWCRMLGEILGRSEELVVILAKQTSNHTASVIAVDLPADGEVSGGGRQLFIVLVGEL